MRLPTSRRMATMNWSGYNELGVLGLDFLRVGGVIGWVEEGVDCIVVHDIAVVGKVMVVVLVGCLRS